MYSVKQLDFAHLSSAVLKDYRNMLDHRFWTYLKSHVDKNIIVLGITKDAIPIGIASGEIYQDIDYIPNSPKRGEIFQLYLKPNESDPEMIENVIAYLENFFKQANCFVINFFLENSAVIQSILEKRGWKGPRNYMANYIFDAPSFHPDWFEQILKTPWPEGYSVFKWKDIKRSDWEAIKLQEKNQVFSHEISPFNVYSGPMENLNSLGLKYLDEVIGWVITHRIKDTIRYTALFIQTPFQMRGLSIKLLAEAIKLQQHSPIAKASMEINLRGVESSWLTFIAKYLEPYSEEKHVELEYWLELKKTNMNRIPVL